MDREIVIRMSGSRETIQRVQRYIESVLDYNTSNMYDKMLRSYKISNTPTQTIITSALEKSKRLRRNILTWLAEEYVEDMDKSRKT